MKKSWFGKRTPRKQAADLREDKAAARQILHYPTRDNTARHFAPAKIRAAQLRGKSELITPLQAARRELKWLQGRRAAVDQHPGFALERIQKTKQAGKKTALGRRFSLRRAHVDRDPTTGRFRRRRA